MNNNSPSFPSTFLLFKKAISWLVFFLSFLLTSNALAGSANLTWNANSEPDLGGYKIYKRTLPSTEYGSPIFSGLPSNPSEPQKTITNLQEGVSFGFITTAFDTSGNESGPSNEGQITISSGGTPPPPPPPTSGIAWTAVGQSSGGSWHNSGFDNRTFRILVKGSAITSTGSTIQLKFRGRSSGSYPIANVSLVQRTGTTLNGENATSRAVTFGGNTNASVPTSGLTSDPIAFNLVPGQDVFLTYWAPAGTAGVFRSGGTSTTAWFITGSDHSSKIDWGGLPISGSRAYVYGAELITK